MSKAKIENSTDLVSAATKVSEKIKAGTVKPHMALMTAPPSSKQAGGFAAVRPDVEWKTLSELFEVSADAPDIAASDFCVITSYPLSGIVVTADFVAVFEDN